METGADYNVNTTCINPSVWWILNPIFKNPAPVTLLIWHLTYSVCTFSDDTSGDILISLETFKCQDSFLSAPTGMMLLWLGRWQLYQLCIRWACVWKTSMQMKLAQSVKWNKWKCWIQSGQSKWVSEKNTWICFSFSFQTSKQLWRTGDKRKD